LFFLLRLFGLNNFSSRLNGLIILFYEGMPVFLPSEVMVSSIGSGVQQTVSFSKGFQ